MGVEEISGQFQGPGVQEAPKFRGLDHSVSERVPTTIQRH